MIYRRLGRSGLQLSALSYGSWVTFYGQIEDKHADELMGIAYDNGINFFDNAETYADGESEKMMGRVLKKEELGPDILHRFFQGLFRFPEKSASQSDRPEPQTPGGSL